MDHEHVPVGAIEPGEDEELVAELDALQTLEHVGLEAEPRVGRTLVPLLGRGVHVGQRRFDPADDPTS